MTANFLVACLAGDLVLICSISKSQLILNGSQTVSDMSDTSKVCITPTGNPNKMVHVIVSTNSHDRVTLRTYLYDENADSKLCIHSCSDLLQMKFFSAINVYENNTFISGQNKKPEMCILGISPTAEMAAFCREVNNLYQALGYSSVNRALDKPIHQHDVPVADTLKLVQSCASWCNDWSKLRSEKMNLVACGSIGCISQCTLNCLKKSSLALKKTV